MTYSQAVSLMSFLKTRCPYRTGNLYASIQAPQGTEKEWVIVIGNDDTSINGTASNKYASILNDAETITRKKKTADGVITYTYRNKHHHWVNAAIREWIFANYNDDAIKLNTEVYSEDE